MDETLKSIRSENERFQKDHREEHIQLDKRVSNVEKYVIEQNAKRDRYNSIKEKILI